MEQKTIEKLAKIASAKSAFSKNHPLKSIVYSMLAGGFVGLGIVLIFSIGAPISASEYLAGATKLVMGVSFGIALSLVIMAGSDLFTGDSMIMSVGLFQKTVRVSDLLRVWIFALLGNFIGALLIAVMMKFSGLLDGEVLGQFIVKMSEAKITPGFWELFFRGLLCNILVCLAVWSANKLKSESGKLIMISMCLFAFIGSGFEHSIANMALIPMGALSKYANEVVNWGGFAKNIIPVVLGNIVGGTCFVALPYWSVSKAKEARSSKTEKSEPALQDQQSA